MNSELYVTNNARDLKVRKVSKNGTKLALLVPNMFNKVSSGYYKNLNKLISSTPAAVEVKTPVIPPVPVVNTTPVQQAQSVEPKIEPSKIEAPVEPVKDKKYIDKASNIDVIFLKNTRIHATEPAKKLLISPAFIQKLVSHRARAIELDSKKEVPLVKASTIAPVKRDVMADTISRRTEAAPVPSVTQVLQKITPDILAKTEKPDPKQEGVKKYIELMNKRKEAIALKQQCEKEMTALVNEFNITLEMVNEELSKQGGQEVA